MAESRSDKLVEEIRFNEKYAHLFYSEYIPEQYDADSLPTIKKKTLFTKDYIERLTGEGVVGGVLPPNCRYIEEMDKGFIVVIEEPPAFRTIKSDYGLSSEISYLKAEGKLDAYGYTNYVSEHSRPYTFQLAFPYVIFILYISKYNEIHDGQAFLRTHQMSGKSDYLLKMPMCNISDSGHICFGNKISGRFQSLTAAIQQAKIPANVKTAIRDLPKEHQAGLAVKIARGESTPLDPYAHEAWYGVLRKEAMKLVRNAEKAAKVRAGIKEVTPSITDKAIKAIVPVAPKTLKVEPTITPAPEVSYVPKEFELIARESFPKFNKLTDMEKKLALVGVKNAIESTAGVDIYDQFIKENFMLAREIIKINFQKM